MSKKKMFICLIILVSLLLVCKLSFKDGQLSLSFLQKVWTGDKPSLFIFFHMRLPALLAIFSTGILAVISTLILQTLSKNELADAMALGYHNVALTSLALLYFFTPALRQLSYLQILFLSILVVLGYSIFMYDFARGKGQVLNGNMMLLVGIGANSFFSTILSYLKTYSPEIKDIFSLLMQGNFDHVDLDYALFLSCLTLIFLVIFILVFPYFKILSLSEEMVYGLGVSAKLLNLGFFVLMSVGIALGLMFGTSFPFVAFTSLHMMRPIYASNSLAFLSASFLMTISAILLSDLIAHYAFSTVLPTNIFLGFFGGLGFVIILLRRRSH